MGGCNKMCTITRLEVINVFRRLHRVCQRVFKGDEEALKDARLKINENFTCNKDLTDTEEIRKLVSEARQIEKVLKERVVQAVLTEDNVYRMQIRDETVLESNSPLPKHKS